MINIDLSRIQTVKQFRFLLNMTQQQFSAEYNIPKRTIGNWEDGTNKCPAYVLSLLRRAVISDYRRLDQIQQEANFFMAVQQREHKDEQDIIDDRFA